MKTASFLRLYGAAVIRPRSTFGQLGGDARLFRFGATAVLITALLYTFVYIFLIMGGGLPFRPWLSIAPEVYYRYNVFFCAPSMFLGWILSAGVVQVYSRLLGGKGSFEQTLGLMGFGISIASWATGIHDFVTSLLGALHIINQNAYELALNSPTIWRTLLWIQMVVYLLWFILLFTQSIRSAQGLKPVAAVAGGLLGFVVYQGFFFIFNR